MTVTDSDSVQVQNGINLESPQQISIVLTSPEYSNGFNVSCFQCSNGSVVTNVSGGYAGPVVVYTYLWDHGATTANLSGLGKGVYKVTVTDQNNCHELADITITEPDREDWAVTGNPGSNPSSQFIGTPDSSDFVMKTNNTERMRIKANGEILIPDNNVLRIRRISSPDSLLYIGDSTMVFNHGQNNISAHQTTSANKGIGIGSGSAIAVGVNAVSLGRLAYASANYSVSIGNNTYVAPNATSGITIGSGVGNSLSTRLTNDMPNSLYIGFNSTIPTLVVTESGGANTTGKVGIGNSSPNKKLEVKTTDDIDGIALNRLHSTKKNSEINFLWSNGSTDAPATIYALGIDLDKDGTNNFFIRANHNNNTPIFIDDHGNVGIQTRPPVADTYYNLYVQGGIVTRELKVTSATVWPDFVYDKNFKLMSLEELEAYVIKNKHLPRMPSSYDVNKNQGFEVGDLQIKQLQHIEEQSLYIISLQKQVNELKAEVAKLKAK